MVALTNSPIVRLRHLISDCATFQDVVGAANRTEALASIHTPYVSAEDVNGGMPRAIIDPVGNQWNAEFVAAGTFSFGGSALVTFEFRVPDAVTDSSLPGEKGKDAYSWFAGKVGEILHEMLMLAATGESVPGETHLNVMGITHVDGPIEYPPEEVDYDGELIEQASHEWLDEYTVEWR